MVTGPYPDTINHSQANYDSVPAREPITFEHKREVMGGLGEGTPDGLAGPFTAGLTLVYYLTIDDAIVLLNPNSPPDERMVAGFFLLPTPGKFVKPFVKHSRKGAFNAAKRDAKIPRNQQPDKVEKVPMRRAEYEGGGVIKDHNGDIIYTREYHYTNQDGKKIIIQDHSAGHGKGNLGPHYNVRPEGDRRTGEVPGTKKHYDFNK